MTIQRLNKHLFEFSRHLSDRAAILTINGTEIHNATVKPYRSER